MPYAVGLDLGGTKILAGVIDVDTGQILSTAIRLTKDVNARHGLIHAIAEVAREALDAQHVPVDDIVAAGIGVAGQVDMNAGVLIRAPNLPRSMVGAHLADELGAALGCSVTVVNDVVAAAAGEAAFGAGKGVPGFVCIFVGTGIGGAIYHGGEPYQGATNTAGELGHMVIDAGGRLCGCGGRGHLEAYASHSAVMRTILGALRQGRESILSHVEPNPNPDDRAHSRIRYSVLADAIRADDALAIEMVTDGARYLAAGLASIINFYNPPRIVLGGGMIQELDLFFDAAVERIEQDALLVPRRDVQILRAILGANSGIVGAAALAAQRVNRQQRSTASA